MYQMLISNILKTNHTQINIQPHSHVLHRSTIFSLSIYFLKKSLPRVTKLRKQRIISLRSSQRSMTRVEWEIRIQVCHLGVLPRAASQCPVGALCLLSGPQGPLAACHFESIGPNVLCISLVSLNFTLPHFSSSHLSFALHWWNHAASLHPSFTSDCFAAWIELATTELSDILPSYQSPFQTWSWTWVKWLPTFTICPGSFSFFSETLKSWKIRNQHLSECILFLHMTHQNWRGSACEFWQRQGFSMFQMCAQRSCVPPT